MKFAPIAARWLRRHKWFLVTLLIFLVTTASFMWPMASHPMTYSEGGDHMFNAWTLARNHHCLLQQGCPTYADGNIFFPHKDAMLYSETQYSAGVLTLPFYLINHNPLFSANVWYLLSALFSGLFMYLLAMYLSKGNRPLSILAGLLFEFAPTKITYMSHLQNLSIFYLPLIILLLLKYRDNGNKKYLWGFGVASSLLFLASWYQMVFGLIVIGLFVAFVLLSEKQKTRAWWLVAATTLALITTLPLARQYIRFSKANQATFSIVNQIGFSSSVDDYVTPYEHTPFGSLYYKLRPHIARNSHNQDNYSYAGVTLYAVFAVCLWQAIKRRRQKSADVSRNLIILLTVVLAAGFIMSLGPAVKLGAHYSFTVQGMRALVPAPYILVDKFLPQLSFMRAIGRASIIVLFALCCLLAIFGRYLTSIKPPARRQWLLTLSILLIGLDVLPVGRLLTGPSQRVPVYETSYSIPAVYKYIANAPVDNIVILRTQKDYSYAGIPIAQAEDVLWAGYHNKNIFNGYSGYEPPEYQTQLRDFTDLQADDLPKMKKLGLRYVLIDKQLSRSDFNQTAQSVFTTKSYEDDRYALYKI